jgi:hypothetical protein
MRDRVIIVDELSGEGYLGLDGWLKKAVKNVGKAVKKVTKVVASPLKIVKNIIKPPKAPKKGADGAPVYQDANGKTITKAQYDALVKAAAEGGAVEYQDADGKTISKAQYDTLLAAAAEAEKRAEENAKLAATPAAGMPAAFNLQALSAASPSSFAPTVAPTSAATPAPTSDATKKALMIGGAVAAGLVVLYLVTKKR